MTGSSKDVCKEGPCRPPCTWPEEALAEHFTGFISVNSQDLRGTCCGARHHTEWETEAPGHEVLVPGALVSRGWSCCPGSAAPRPAGALCSQPGRRPWWEAGALTRPAHRAQQVAAAPQDVRRPSQSSGLAAAWGWGRSSCCPPHTPTRPPPWSRPELDAAGRREALAPHLSGSRAFPTASRQDA